MHFAVTYTFESNINLQMSKQNVPCTMFEISNWVLIPGWNKTVSCHTERARRCTKGIEEEKRGRKGEWRRLPSPFLDAMMKLRESKQYFGMLWWNQEKTKNNRKILNKKEKFVWFYRIVAWPYVTSPMLAWSSWRQESKNMHATSVTQWKCGTFVSSSLTSLDTCATLLMLQKLMQDICPSP